MNYFNAIQRHIIASFPESVSTFVNWFSIVHNGKKLIKYNRNNNLNIFNGLKTVTMILILFGHVILYKSTHPTLYAMRFEEVTRCVRGVFRHIFHDYFAFCPICTLQLYKIGPDILLTCMNFVDPFFFISGYLIYVMIKPNLTKRDTSWTQIPKIVFYKYLRYNEHIVKNMIFKCTYDLKTSKTCLNNTIISRQILMIGFLFSNQVIMLSYKIEVKKMC